MVNPRDTAGNADEEEEEEDINIQAHSSYLMIQTVANTIVVESTQTQAWHDMSWRVSVYEKSACRS